MRLDSWNWSNRIGRNASGHGSGIRLSRHRACWATWRKTPCPTWGMFYLQRNADLVRHVAQIRLLLDSGLKPERIILVLLPIDTTPLGKQPLHTMVVNSRGAITYRLRPPTPPFDALIRSSRLAMLAWVRGGLHVGNPKFQSKHVTDSVVPPLQEDLATMFHVLGATSRQHHVPVTTLLLPNREQIFGKAGYALQDFVREQCRVEGMDCFDARDLFVDEPDKLSLFLPDWHFTTKSQPYRAVSVVSSLENGAGKNQRAMSFVDRDFMWFCRSSSASGGWRAVVIPPKSR